MIVPVEPLREKIAVRGTLLVRPGGTEPGRVRAWEPAVVPTGDNVIILSGTRLQLFPGVPRGEWDMIVAVGRPGPSLPEGDLLRLADQGAPVGDVQVLKKRIVLEGACSNSHPCPDEGEDGAP